MFSVSYIVNFPAMPWLQAVSLFLAEVPTIRRMSHLRKKMYAIPAVACVVPAVVYTLFSL